MSDVERYAEKKEQFMAEMEALRPDLAFPESWSEAKKTKAVAMVRPGKLRSAMFASIPLKCTGSQCTFAEICPLQQEGLAPVSKPCPIEMSAVQQFMHEYIETLGVDPENLIEVSMVRDMVDQEIQQQRTTWMLSLEHFIQENVVGIAPNGEVIMQKQLHLAVDMADRIHRRKRDLRNQLLATREARAKAGQGSMDTAQVISNLVGQVDKIRQEQNKALRKRLGYEDVDEYILEAEVVEDEDHASG